MGDIVVYFPAGCCISDRYLGAHNLFDGSCTHKNKNGAEYGLLTASLAILMAKPGKTEKDISQIQEMEARKKSMTGFFNAQGRVRILKLRGQVSMGYVAPVETLEAVYPELKSFMWSQHLGENFDMIGKEILCWKYIPATAPKTEPDGPGYKMPWYKRSLRKLKKFNRLIPGFFRPHYDTAMLERNAHLINPSDVITETVKVHGCVERGTLVETQEFGELTIGEIVDKKLDCHIKAYDTDLDEVVFVPIGDWYLLKNDGEWYDIELEDGTKLTITGNNPVWIPEINGYRRVDELTGNESLLVS